MCRIDTALFLIQFHSVTSSSRRLVNTYKIAVVNFDKTMHDICNINKSGARFTKYLTTTLRLSYDNAKVTIDLPRTSNLQNILRRMQGFSLSRIHLQNRKIV